MLGEDGPQIKRKPGKNVGCVGRRAKERQRTGMCVGYVRKDVALQGTGSYDGFLGLGSWILRHEGDLSLDRDGLLVQVVGDFLGKGFRELVFSWVVEQHRMSFLHGSLTDKPYDFHGVAA